MLYVRIRGLSKPRRRWRTFIRSYANYAKKVIEMDQNISAPTARLRVLVAIANYGTSNDHYLARLIQEYHAMSYDVHVVIHSNVKKQLEGTEILVGLPNRNPWSLLSDIRKFLQTESIYTTCLYIRKMIS